MIDIGDFWPSGFGSTREIALHVHHRGIQNGSQANGFGEIKARHDRDRATKTLLEPLAKRLPVNLGKQRQLAQHIEPMTNIGRQDRLEGSVESTDTTSTMDVFTEKRDHVWIHLTYDKVRDIKPRREGLKGQVIVDAAVDPLLSRVEARYDLASFVSLHEFFSHHNARERARYCDGRPEQDIGCVDVIQQELSRTFGARDFRC